MATIDEPRRWPPREGLSTPTVSRKNAILPVVGSCSINAPASVVWKVLLNTAKWSEWNTFVPKVEIHEQPDSVDQDSKVLHVGTLMTFDAVMNPAKPDKTNPTKLRVNDISTPEKQSDYVPEELLQDGSFTSDLNKIYRISWTSEGGFPGLITERFHEIIITSGESCECRTWEVMGGMLARTVKWMFDKTLQDRFADWCRDLKGQAEKVYQESGPSA